MSGLRIIAGERRGFVLSAPKGMATRPTLSRVRESLFSILGMLVPDARVADLYAGAGSLGFEALSRGAHSCDFVDKSRAALEALRRNAEKLGFSDRAQIHAEDVARWLRRAGEGPPWDIVMVDPPYGTGEAEACLRALAESGRVGPGAEIIVQCGSRETMPKATGALRNHRTERYGETALWFFCVAANDENPPPDSID